jgi:hypothetical protein
MQEEFAWRKIQGPTFHFAFYRHAFARQHDCNCMHWRRCYISWVIHRIQSELYFMETLTRTVTSTPSENLSLHLYEAQNKNFNVGTTETLILHTRSIFFKGGHLTKYGVKNIFHENSVEVRSFDAVYGRNSWLSVFGLSFGTENPPPPYFWYPPPPQMW